MGPPMWPWCCGLMARPVSGVEWSGVTGVYSAGSDTLNGSLSINAYNSTNSAMTAMS